MRKNLVARTAMALVVPAGIVLAEIGRDGTCALAAVAPLLWATAALAVVLGLTADRDPGASGGAVSESATADDLRSAA